MLALLKNHVREVRTALWFRPAVFCVVAIVAAAGIASIGTFVPPDMLRWLPEIETDTVKELLKLLAGGMLTVTTVTLSVLMLVLTLASQQASPRAVPEVMADPVTQNTLGVFLATFVYALTGLLMFGLVTVDKAGATLNFFFALALGALSIRYLLHWIDHVAHAVKLNRIISRVFGQAETAIAAYFTKFDAEQEPSLEAPEIEDPDVISADRAGYVQLIDEKSLREIAAEHGLRVAVETQEGDFVNPAESLLLVSAPDGERCPDSVLADLKKTVVIGFERSSQGDPRLGMELLAEIACRALSPGINDPQTAITCIGYIGSLLATLGERPADTYPPAAVDDARIGFRRPTFAHFLRRAYRPIIRDGRTNVEVLLAVQTALTIVARSAKPDYLDLIANECARVTEYAEQSIDLGADKDALKAGRKTFDDAVRSRRGKG